MKNVFKILFGLTLVISNFCTFSQIEENESKNYNYDTLIKHNAISDFGFIKADSNAIKIVIFVWVNQQGDVIKVEVDSTNSDLDQVFL